MTTFREFLEESISDLTPKYSSPSAFLDKYLETIDPQEFVDHFVKYSSAMPKSASRELYDLVTS